MCEESNELEIIKKSEITKNKRRPLFLSLSLSLSLSFFHRNSDEKHLFFLVHG